MATFIPKYRFRSTSMNGEPVIFLVLFQLLGRYRRIQSKAEVFIASLKDFINVREAIEIQINY